MTIPLIKAVSLGQYRNLPKTFVRPGSKHSAGFASSVQRVSENSKLGFFRELDGLEFRDTPNSWNEFRDTIAKALGDMVHDPELFNRALDTLYGEMKSMKGKDNGLFRFFGILNRAWFEIPDKYAKGNYEGPHLICDFAAKTLPPFLRETLQNKPKGGGALAVYPIIWLQELQKQGISGRIRESHLNLLITTFSNYAVSNPARAYDYAEGLLGDFPEVRPLAALMLASLSRIDPKRAGEYAKKLVQIDPSYAYLTDTI